MEKPTVNHLQKIAPTLVLSIIFAMSYFIFFNQVYNNLLNKQYLSDLPLHIEFAKSYFNGTMYIPHPGFHYAIYYISILTTLKIADSATLILAGCVTFTYYLIYRTISNETKSQIVGIVLMVICFLFAPIFIPFFNDKMYLGQIHANLWHSPTLVMLKPLIILSILFTPKLFVSSSKKTMYINHGLLALIMAVSTWVKPNFVIAFLPALLIVYLIFKRNIRQFIHIGITSIPSALILLYQFTHTYEDTDSKIIVDIFGVWKQWSDSPTFSVILSLAFPLTVLLFRAKQVIKNDYLVISWVALLVSIVQFAIFAESGDRFAHGNFGWGMQGAIVAVLLFSLIEWYKWLKEADRRIQISIILLGLHLSSGILYLIKILTGRLFM